MGLKDDVRIFVNENLSPFISQLAFYCRQLKKVNLISKVTTFKGVVKITRSLGVENRPVTSIIRHKIDLANIFPDLNNILNI